MIDDENHPIVLYEYSLKLKNQSPLYLSDAHTILLLYALVPSQFPLHLDHESIESRRNSPRK
jgi:hypothetical protein